MQFRHDFSSGYLYFCSLFKDAYSSTSFSIGSNFVISFIFCSVIVFQCITEPSKCELKNLNLHLVARKGNVTRQVTSVLLG